MFSRSIEAEAEVDARGPKGKLVYSTVTGIVFSACLPDGPGLGQSHVPPFEGLLSLPSSRHR